MRRLLLALVLIVSACAADDPGSEGVPTSFESNEASRDEQPTATRPLELTDPAATPRLDRARAAVPLDEIIFDTFDGGSVPLSEADDELVDRLFDALPPIDAPAYQSADDASWLADDDLVVGFVDPSGAAWAFSVRVLNFREIVNDELGGLPVVITYCPLCGSGVVFERTLDGRQLSFSNSSALFENDMVMVDRETGSYWWQVSGAGIVGGLTGSQLALLASQTTTWASWSEQYPDTLVMQRPDGQSFGRDPFVTYGETLDAGRTPFRVSEGVLEDDRLPPSARVVTVTVNGETRAWATAPARTVEDRVGGVGVTVIADGTGAIVLDSEGVPMPNRSAFWFSVLTIDADTTLGS